MKPELYLSDALGAVGKPMFRVHTAGLGRRHDRPSWPPPTSQAGKHRTVLAVAFEKQSEGNAQFALGSGRGASLGAGGAFAPFMRAYIHRSGAPEHIGWKVAVKDRLQRPQEPLRPPEDRGHLHREGQGVAHDVGAHPLPRVVPVLRRCVCRGLHRSRRVGTRRPSAGRPPAWILGTAVRSEPPSLPRARSGPPAGRGGLRRGRLRPGRDHRPPTPDRHGRALRPVLAGTSRCGSRPTTSPDRARAGSMVDDGTTELGGDFPVNPSGGVLSSNPIGASGLLRFAEAANQVRGRSGRAPGAGRPGGPGPGVRRQRPVLRDVGRVVLARPLELTPPSAKTGPRSGACVPTRPAAPRRPDLPPPQDEARSFQPSAGDAPSYFVTLVALASRTR